MSTTDISPNNPMIIDQVRQALAEDMGSGDVSAGLVSEQQQAHATLTCRQPAVLCGIPWFEACLYQMHADTQVHWQFQEGDTLPEGALVCNITGSARSILTAERCALNFLQTLSAVATTTQAYVNKVTGTPAQIFDTRKTIPGLRLAEKYAVRVGGGHNQRMGLYDGILIKENHIQAAGGLIPAIQAAQQRGRYLPIQVEVERLEQLDLTLQQGITFILLDNFSITQLREAVALNRGRAILEASGNIGLDNVRQVAETGVQRISIGALTKHIAAIDFSIRIRM